MFILSIFLAGREAPLYLNYKYRPVAEAARQGGADMDSFIAADDFGHSVEIARSSVSGTMITDLEAEHALHADMQVLQAKAQLAAQRKLQADPALKFAAGLMNGGGMAKPPFMT